MKSVKLLLVIALASFAIGGYAQSEKSAKELAKERKELRNLSRNELNEKASKAARKEAKRYIKEGWKVMPGHLPLEKQLDRSYRMQYEFNDNMMDKYLWGNASSIGENYDAAKMQALDLAKQNLIAKIQTDIFSFVKSNVYNKQLHSEEAASVVETVAASQAMLEQNLGALITVVEAYRVLSNKNREVLVIIAYNADEAREIAKNVIRKELEKKGDELHKKIDELKGW